MSNEQQAKRMTFQGLISADKQKLPQKSRSRSKSRTKANSITKSLSGASFSNRSWKKVETSKSIQIDKSETSQSGKDNIFRQKKKNVEQQLMKKIIKLKNHSMRIENSLKQQLAFQSSQQTIKKKESKEQLKFQELQNFLEEFDVEVRRQVKQIGDSYSKQLQNEEKLLQNSDNKIPQYKFLTFSHISPQMPTLEAKLKDMEARWNK